jgi:hypothetical protein
MTVVKKSAKRAPINRVEKMKAVIYHGYTYNNKNVITNLFNRGFSRELKGGYKL